MIGNSINFSQKGYIIYLNFFQKNLNTKPIFSKKLLHLPHKDRELYKYAEIVYAITQKNMQNTPIF